MAVAELRQVTRFVCGEMNIRHSEETPLEANMGVCPVLPVHLLFLSQ